MRLFLNVLAPFFLLNSFASATYYNIVVQWASDKADDCTSDMIENIGTRIAIESNSVLAGQGRPEVDKWDRSVNGSRRQLRVRELCGACAYTNLCYEGSTCYSNYDCQACGYRREERELLIVANPLTADEITIIESDFKVACEGGLNKELSRPGNNQNAEYSDKCKTAMQKAIDNHLCYSLVSEA
jgi:hypothetical protein